MGFDSFLECSKVYAHMYMFQLAVTTRMIKIVFPANILYGLIELSICINHPLQFFNKYIYTDNINTV